VFVAEKDSAVKRPVKLGAYDGDRVMVLEGLSQGEQLVVLGHRDLVDGQPVNIVE